MSIESDVAEQTPAVSPQKGKNILVVGAGGFSGSFIVQQAILRGYRVWAGVRESTSRRYLSDPRINFAVFDYDSPEALKKSIADALPSSGRWDYIVYNLGATKCVNFADFNRINHDYLVWFLDALKELDIVPDKFLFISSLSVMGQGDEKGYTPFTEKMVPAPNTRYGTSKLKAEMALQASGIPYIIFRATGIYGPHERDYFLMFKSIKRGVDFSVGFKRQELTFIYVEDLAVAVLDALERSETAKTYLISENQSYTQKQFRSIVSETLGKKFVLPVVAPLWVLKIVCKVSARIAAMKGTASTLNPDKYNIMRQRNWNVDTTAAREGFGFAPKVDLKSGVEESISWYRNNKWL